ncbi:serine/threonine-protein kinase [Micromonospora sp. WMMD980]|uniref:serine/threonine-protein kinase n=1 Tax=Micromonospora sp. WMMD980 TaxID=3016088 RepID=UPI002417EFC0|nr:serine/threonine-protein kinase [Micromonospora sp. WMMD980]MDG4804242.1 serine/threonine-protein kinase [Micromonospora sp. WMMD980]
MTETPPGALRLPIVPGLTDLEVFARGGYATVYRATQISVGREVAVKVENRTLDSERDQARFLREARAAGRMSSHPHVVDLFDVGVTVDQHPYLIMELCDGSYAERMRTSPLGPLETRDLGVKIADALAHSHAAGVLHRDVKPANILHSEFNSAVLADFGLAVLAEVRDASVTMEVLTPAYAPPEMFSHSPPSPAVDVYALCATLYAVMHGRPPRWQSERNPSLVTVLEMFQQPIPGLPGVPEELVDVLRLGMSNDPGARPSAVELRGMLAALPLDPGAPTPPFVGTCGPYCRPDGPSPRQPVKDEHPTVPARSRRWPRRWFLGGAGVLALAASAGGGAWLAGGSTSGVSPTVLATGAAGATPLPGCASADVRLPAGARCGSELECYGPVRLRRDRAEASRVPCDGQHTWETYAAGDLPAALAGAAYDAVTADPAVRKICNTGTLRLVSGAASASGWNLEVLPPDATGSDRTYRCLAGQGVNALARPTLTGR